MVDEDYMRFAIEEGKTALAKGEIPIGAVIVYEDKVIAKGHNEREALKDPTAHAEMIAIRKAARKLGSWRLLNSTIYVTVEPCPMCAGAIQQARIKRLVYGAEDPKAGAVESLYRIVEDKRLNHQVELRGGVLKDECGKLMQEFFKNLRGSENN